MADEPQANDGEETELEGADEKPVAEAQADEKPAEAAPLPKILLVDDEDGFRQALVKRVSARGYEVLDVASGEEAVKAVRHEQPEVVVLDQKMPGMDGVETLQQIKEIRPEVQVVMLTGFATVEAARKSGKHDVFRYLGKPCDTDELLEAIEDARQERVHAMGRHEIPIVNKETVKHWLVGAHNHRPGVIALGLAIFVACLLCPTSKGLRTFLSTPKNGEAGQAIAGYSDYRKMAPGQTISEYYSKKARLEHKDADADGNEVFVPLTPDQVGFRARAMVGTLAMAALFWATGAVPIGITALLVGAVMVFLGVLPPDLAAKAYAKDSVIFVFGVLAISVAIGKTGLDRRIGLLLLGTSTSLARFAFIFAPMLAATASFLSEHALVAFLAPILMLVYVAAIKSGGLKQDRGLAVMMLLMLTFTANIGGPGSPAAGGRNAVMLGILSDYGQSVSFVEWVKHGFLFVPVMALVIAAYFFLVFRSRIKTRGLDVAAQVRAESERIGKMTPDEYKAAGLLLLLIVLWVGFSHRLGMGAPALFCLVLANIMGLLRWRDINTIHWDVVALYAAASALGYGLAVTGAALWLANGFVSLLPEAAMTGTGLCMSSSLITGVLTNFMSDGATVAAVGPITVPMATLASADPVHVGLATAFSSSFAHMFVIGTPNNAIVYSIARDKETGEQLITMRDFLVHGSAVLVLSLAVLWFWVFLGYWRWLGL